MNIQTEIYDKIKECNKEIEILKLKIDNTSSFQEKHFFLNELLLKKHYAAGLNFALNVIQKNRS